MPKNSIIAGQSSGNLNFETAQKIIHRFLTEERVKTALDDGRVINPALPNKCRCQVLTNDKECKGIRAGARS